MVHDVRALAEVARGHEALLVVDAISGLGATELRQDEWGVDVVVAGSQKALMCPPGLGFVSASQRALDFAAARPAPRAAYYFDWARAIAEQRKSAPATCVSTTGTPVISMIAVVARLIATPVSNSSTICRARALSTLPISGIATT